jgi:hypothetical protein
MLFCVDCGYSAQVTLTWDANTEATLAGYKIYYGHSSRAYEHSVDVYNQTDCTLTELEDGETYYFAATAYDIYDNETAFSEEVTWTSPLASGPHVGISELSTCLSCHFSTCIPPADEAHIEIGEADINHDWVHVSFNEPFWEWWKQVGLIFRIRNPLEFWPLIGLFE